MPDLPPRVPVCLTIAGSDSGGGAGIQADLKAFAACGVHGASAITAITAQNTLAVTGVWPVPPDAIVAQIAAVVDDLDVAAVKIGMLGSAESTAAVARGLALLDPGVPVVVDPVMVAESGARLLDEGAVTALVELILPRATVVTPNLPEARVLAGHPRAGDPRADHSHADHPRADREGAEEGTRRPAAAIPAAATPTAATPEAEAAEAEELARAIHRLGPSVVVVTGGHRTEAIDTVFDGTTVTRIRGERHADGAAHGSGCTHASVLAAQLALGLGPVPAAREAKARASAAVRDGLRGVGAGAGPVDVLGLAARRGAPARPGDLAS
ncbi:hydroxymethylpyrimidine/phosphomethylpyrimidine kinase [Paraconexibacter antarcticus]|uniref:Hydroxymethylpyrimidine/phosphomethylpyrimidine kinase n=1 Tax=Paraconexibacter antarcticus TaxID=2949664 RepID=A0ABY5DMA7_9ACTN|nr:bifunctional hydroxymethylpyrimidine kinase/phosphomethylpyrimidine kinase [Paraconexibacter antarcticus]UTI63080.1 hydroxymethylpyrimidine/phosphomethylpyrimidine kinase [Paraconexibacter antarcticus]